MDNKTEKRNLLPKSETLLMKSTPFYIAYFSVFIPLFYILMTVLLNSYVKKVLPVPLEQFHLPIGGILTIAGGAFILFSVFELHRVGEGWPVSSSPPKRFVNTGPYRLSRHPIYLGGFLMFEGFSFLFNYSSGVYFTGPLFLFFFSWYAGNIEEPVLEKRYGEIYLQYKLQTPLFFPSPTRKLKKWIVYPLLRLVEYAANHPIIIQKGNHIFYVSYGILCATGIVTGLMLFGIFLRSYGFSEKQIVTFIMLITALSLFGIRIVWMLGVKWWSGMSWKDVLGRVGFVSWGVLVGTLIAGFIFNAMTGKSMWLWLDLALFSQIVTHIFGRLGCLTYGCCYGKESTSMVALNFRHPALKCNREHLLESQQLFPVQLFSALHGVVILVLVSVIWWQQTPPVSFPFILTGLLYTIFRNNEEMARVQKKIFFGFFSAPQLLCHLFWIFGLGWLWKIKLSPPDMMHPPLAELIYFPYKDIKWIGLFGIIWIISFLIFSYHYKEIGRWT